MGRALVQIVLLLVIMSALLRAAPKVPLLSWVGYLPGDLRIPMGRGVLFIPIASAVVVSLILSVLWRLLPLLVR